MSASKSAAGNLTTSLLLLPLGILMSIFLARILGPSDRGVYAFLALFGETLFPLILLGSSTGVFYYISSEKYDVHKVALTALTMGAFSGLNFAILVVLLWQNGWLGQTAKNTDFSIVVPILITMPLTGICWMSKQIFQGTGRFNILNMIDTGKFISKFLLLFLFVVVLRTSVKGAVIALAIEDILATAIILWMIRRKIRPEWTYDKTFVKDAYLFGLRSWIGTLGGRANDKLDQLILGFVGQPALLGYYNNAYSVLRFLGFVPNAVAPVLFKMVAKTDDIEKSAKLTSQIHRVLFLIVGLMALTMWIAAPWLIPFMYGEAFRPSVLPFRILLLGSVFFWVTRRTISKFMTANGLNLNSSIIQLVGALAGVIAYLILIPPYDFIGAAIGSVLAYLISTATALLLFYRVAGGEVFRFFAFSLSDIRWLRERATSFMPFKKKQKKKKHNHKTPEEQDTPAGI